MSGVGPVANRRDGRQDASSYAASSRRRLSSLFKKSSALIVFGAALSFWQPSPTGHLDAAHLLGLDGPGGDRWTTFLTASPAGSVHQATMHLHGERGTDLEHAGVGQVTPSGVLQAAFGPLPAADDIITGSIPDQSLPSDADPLIARDARAHRLETYASQTLFASRRAPPSLVDAHPFARLELASLPSSGFTGHIGLVPPAPEMIVAEDASDADADNDASYALAMVDPSAGGSPLEDTEGQRQISAFLNNDRQFECLAEGIYFEARGEPRRGQVAVAQVIMNRVNHDEFPDTICGVVYQNQHWRNRCQFSFACDGVPERITERGAWSEAESVARQVLEERDLIETITESTHYHANYVRPRWAPRMIRLDRIGLHIFYKGRYGGWR